MHVLTLTEHQRATIRSLDETVEALAAKVAEAERVRVDAAKELEGARRFRTEALNGMCAEKFEDCGDYEAVPDDSGEHLIYQPRNLSHSLSGYELQGLAAMQNQPMQGMGGLGSYAGAPNWLANAFPGC